MQSQQDRTTACVAGSYGLSLFADDLDLAESRYRDLLKELGK